MAGPDMGFYALPEKGDQVLVAFEQGDLSQPYVLGSLWTTQQQAAGDQRGRHQQPARDQEQVRPRDHLRRHRRRRET